MDALMARKAKRDEFRSLLCRGPSFARLEGNGPTVRQSPPQPGRAI